MSRKTRVILAIAGMIAIFMSQLAVVYINPHWSHSAWLAGLLINVALAIWAIGRPRRTP